MAAGGGGGVGGGSSAQGGSAANQGVTQAAELVRVLQSMIDVSAERLEGLRTHCATSAELTQNEIRILEVCLLTPARIYKHVELYTSPCYGDKVESEYRKFTFFFTVL